MNLSLSYKKQHWSEYQDVPAIRASVLVLFFFAAAFLNYGFMLLACVAYLFASIANMKKGKMPLLQQCMHFLSLETAVLIVGVVFEICFAAWKPSFPSIAVPLRTLLWLLLAVVLLSTKAFLITHTIDAYTDSKWFAHKLKSTKHIVLALILLLAALLLLIAAYAGPAAVKIPGFLLKTLVPGIV